MPTTTLTDADLLRLAAEGYKVELVDGEIRMSPAGMEQERIVARLLVRMGSFAESHGLGDVFGSSAGYHIPRGELRSPDVSFVAGERTRGRAIPKGFADFAPDLAVEILSPWDRPAAVQEKVAEYLRGGVRLVWVVDPQRREAAVHREGRDVLAIAADQALDGEDVLPGFLCPLAELLG